MGTPGTADAGNRVFQPYVALLSDLYTIEDEAETKLQGAKDDVKRAEEELNHAPASHAAQTHLARCQERESELRSSFKCIQSQCLKSGMGLALILDEDTSLQLGTPPPPLQQHEMILDRWQRLFTNDARISAGLEQPPTDLIRPEGIPYLAEETASTSSSISSSENIC